MVLEHAIGQEIAKLGLRPSVNDELGDEMNVCARVDLMRDARRDDAQDRRGTLAALIEPREQPVFAAEDQTTQLAFAPVVRDLDVAIFEEEREARPLPMHVSESCAERSLGRDHEALLIDPRAKAVDDELAVLLTPREALLCSVTGERRAMLDLEQRREQADRFERELVATPSSFNEPSACVRHAARASSTGALDAVGDARAIALDGTPQIGTEEVTHALTIATRRVEEAHPPSIRPAPDGAYTDPLEYFRVEHGDTSRVGAEVSRGTRSISDESRDG